MPGVTVPEREGTRAVLRHSSTPATKVRQVLDLIRGQDVSLATEILANGDREAATTVGKVLASAVANATHNDGLDPEELYVSICYADEGTTLKRWRPRARGRATRIRKRTSHITIVVSRMPDERLARHRAKQSAGTSQRSRRVAGSRRRQRARPCCKRVAVRRRLLPSLRCFRIFGSDLASVGLMAIACPEFWLGPVRKVKAGRERELPRSASRSFASVRACCAPHPDGAG